MYLLTYLLTGMRTPTNALLVAMAVSDTLTGMSPIPVYLYFYTSGRCRISTCTVLICRPTCTMCLIYLYFYTSGRYQDYVPYHWCFLYFCLGEHLPTIFHTASVWLTVALGVQRSVLLSTLVWCMILRLYYCHHHHHHHHHLI